MKRLTGVCQGLHLHRRDSTAFLVQMLFDRQRQDEEVRDDLIGGPPYSWRKATAALRNDLLAKSLARPSKEVPHTHWA